MIVIRGYTKFRRMLSSREPGRFQNSGEIELVKRQALDIVQAVLYVKQHSINCISAAMYAMSRLDPALFPAEEAELFVSGLFSRRDGLPGGEFVQPENVPKIKSHILTLYRRFIEEGKNAGDWCEPLLRFLSRLPRAGERGH
jgi:hypothetical protein